MTIEQQHNPELVKIAKRMAGAHGFDPELRWNCYTPSAQVALEEIRRNRRGLPENQAHFVVAYDAMAGEYVIFPEAEWGRSKTPHYIGDGVFFATMEQAETFAAVQNGVRS